MHQVIEQDLSREELQKLRNNRTGLFLFQFSWILVFVCLIVVNLQMRGNFVSWPPPGIDRLPQFLPVIATVALLISSVMVHRANTRLRAGNILAAESGFTQTVALGAFFVAIMFYEFSIVPADAGQYGAIFRLMTGFHGAHAVVIGLYLWHIRRKLTSGAYGPRNFWSVEAGVKLWDFVTVAWVLFFAVLYVI
jgi:cytochrome c oxidase subunit 3